MAECRVKIGLTMRVVNTLEYHEPRDAIAHDWQRFLDSAFPHNMCMYLPNLGEERIARYCEDWGINALILTGGENIETTPLRDETEHALLSWAERKEIPVLGICRGMQMLANAAGTGLRHVSNHVNKRHLLRGEIARTVNSYHSLSLADCPKNYVVTARAADGEIEAIRHETTGWEGWMWHPEREDSIDEADVTRIQRILK